MDKRERVKLYNILKTNNSLKTGDIADKMRLGFNVVKANLSLMWQLELVERNKKEYIDNYGRTQETDYWKLT